MAAKTPNLLSDLRAAPTTSAYINPLTGAGVVAGSVFRGQQMDYRNLNHRTFFFDNIDNGDTWTSGITGMLEVAAYDYGAAATMRATATVAGVVTFATSADNLQVVLHVWSAT